MKELPMRMRGNKEVVDWKKINAGDEFTIGETTVVVDENWREMKLSKRMKVYYVRRLIVHIKGRFTKLEVGSSSFKKGSFVKRLMKLTSNETKSETTSYLPMIYVDGVQKDFLGNFMDCTWQEISNRFSKCRTKKDVSKVYGTYMKYLHPDKVNDNREGCKVAIEILTTLRDYERVSVEEIIRANEIMAYMRTLFEEDVA